jgi:putative FmdB family regulatory protein
MPIYCYRAVDSAQACEHCREIFEVHQRMSEEALAACPQCGAPIERIITSVYFGTSLKDRLSDKRLKQLGFKKYVKDDKGKYTDILEKQK